MTKICAKCGIENDESEYYVIRSKDRRPRLQGICKECHNGPRKVRLPRVIPEGKTCNNCGQYKALTEFHKHTTCLYGVEPICKECRLRKRREFVLKYPERRKSADLKHAYGISLAEYEVMFQRQNGKCAICCQTERKLVVDHNHTTNKVRGLLCNACNSVIGHCHENIAVLVSAAAYLYAELHPEQGRVRAEVRFVHDAGAEAR